MDINTLSKLNFDGRGESFVEQSFLYPLLQLLGYETYKDYEVLRHGDDGASFKLKYPPVEKGAKANKNYNPDYVPTIRKKAFWIIEAKSPKDVPFPFDYSYIVQGLQYCIHPEIQAHYMILSNGKNTSIYQPYKDVYFGDESLFEPILSFSAKELPQKWNEIYNLFATENIRKILEEDLRKFYEKLALSSFDKNYPDKLLKNISKNKHELSRQITKANARTYCEEDRKRQDNQIEYLKSLTTSQLYKQMEYRPVIGNFRKEIEAYYYIEKARQEKNDEQIFETLTKNYEKFSIFRKEQTIFALNELFGFSNKNLKEKIAQFIANNMKLSLLNEVEALQLRITNRTLTISIYPDLRKKLDEMQANAPEIIRFVFPYSTITATRHKELDLHEAFFDKISKYNTEQLNELKNGLIKIELAIEEKYKMAKKEVKSNDIEICSFAHYGIGHETIFKNLLFNELKQSVEKLLEN